MQSDGDRHRSRFAIGDRVSVILNERNRTARTGAVRDCIWHFKEQRWTYYLVVEGKKISKRYYGEDLRPVDSRFGPKEST